ncbi:MAG: cyclic nucleotide-binding domain-containing protein [Candidatus Electrothrix sp. GW3-4]|uniref:cyclic nucleotide-binding domain-containing protein n=1 Tax=Candidatus Electrothrix sp. GW3-4 TaxID=3126740 RepID=UPI0030D0116E
MYRRNAVFVVTEEHTCPVYRVGDEFIIRDSTISAGGNKELCVWLVQELLTALDESNLLKHRLAVPSQPGVRQKKFECGGCTGLIRFEYKKEVAYSTLQMNLLELSKKRAKNQLVGKFFELLRGMELFEPLDDFDLQDLALLMKLEKHPANTIIIESGAMGTHFYVVLAGEVAVVRDDTGVIAELGPGDIFGEMSLLSGELTSSAVHSKTPVELASLKATDFKSTLSTHPVLQVFFYRVLVDRVQKNTLRAGNITSGMNGELSDINTVELFQLINSGGKTGKVDFIFDGCKGGVLFNAGEIVFCKCDRYEGKNAVFHILAKQDGQFFYSKGLSEEERQLPVLGGFMGLIMEGLRRIDENEAIEEEQKVCALGGGTE